MYPVIIPIRSEPERCPKCREIEHKVEVCDNCNYQYPEDIIEYPFWYVSLFCSVVITFLAFYLGGLIEWTYGYGDFYWWTIPLFLLFIGLAAFLIVLPWSLFSKEKDLLAQK